MRSPLTPVPPVVKLDGEAESLAKLVESALRSNKPDKVLALVPTRDTIKGCPHLAQDAAKRWGSFEKAIAHTAEQVRTAFIRCAALGSWAQAKRTSARQTRTRPQPVDGCKRLIQHGNIYLAYVVGMRPVTVKLAAPARVDGKHWVLLDGLRCRLAGDAYR